VANHEVSDADWEALTALKRHGVIEGEHIYRMRLFSPYERRTILMALPGSAAGMLDELEMVNFNVHGKLLTDLRSHRG
jgi:hypothetical protein